MRSDHSLAEILNIRSSEECGVSFEDEFDQTDEPIVRETEEYQVEELESVLMRPAGPIRISEAEVGANPHHVDLLQGVMNSQGDMHANVAIRDDRRRMLYALASGVGVGVFAATLGMLLFIL